MIKLEQILESIARNIFLSQQEKKDMRDNLDAYAKFHSVRMEASARLPLQRSYFSVYSLSAFLRKKTMPIVLILALMFGGGGVSYAAEGAVPGDALYTIKVSVNEEVRNLVAFAPEAKAEWATRLVERRLEEAEQLAQETGAIPPAAQEVIEQKIEKHIAKIEVHLARVEEKKNVVGASEISAKLETTLRSHISVLEKVQEKQEQKVASAASVAAGTKISDDASIAAKPFSKDRSAALTEKLTQSAEKIALRREAHLETLAFEGAPEREEAAENQKSVAEKKIAEFTRTFEEKSEKLSDAVRVRLEEGISQMKSAFSKGEEAMSREAYGEAFRFFQEAGALAQKLTIFLRSENKLGIDVSEAVQVKPLVRPVTSATETRILPVPPTDESTRKESAESALRKASVYFDETKKLFEEHQTKLPDDIAKRIRISIGTAEELIAHGKRAFEAGEYGTAYLSGHKAVTILAEARDIIRKYITTDTIKETVVDELTRARNNAAGTLEKAKITISESQASDEAIRKAKALYEEATFAFSQGERAMKAGAPKEALEFFAKVVRIYEEISKILSQNPTEPNPPTIVPIPTVNVKDEIKDETEDTAVICDYAAPPRGCSYVKGSDYNAETGCGLVLECPTISTTKEEVPVTNTTGTKAEKVETGTVNYY